MLQLIAGIDEVGRGPLAGPVVAAAVILDPAKPIAGLTDSKKLTERQRERLYTQICRESYLFIASVVLKSLKSTRLIFCKPAC